MKEKSLGKYLFFIILIGFSIRILGINYGLPGAYHTDEPYLIKNALWMGAHHSLKPFFYTYPTFYSYLLLFFYGVYFVVGNLLGTFSDALDFGAQFIVEPTNFYLIGRAISLILGSATGVLVYLLGKNGYSKKVGLVSALFLMISYAHKFHSQMALPDVTMIFLATLAMLFAQKIGKRGKWKHYFLAGFFAGLAISTKYNCGFLVIAIGTAHFLPYFRGKEKNWYEAFGDPRLYFAYFACAFAFVLATPYWVLDFQGFYEEFKITTAHMHTGHLGETGGLPYFWVIVALAKRELLLGIFYIFGTGFAVYKRNFSDIIFLAFILPTLLYVGSWQKKGLDYLYPLFPIMAILAAKFLFSIINKIKRLRSLNYIIILITLITLPTAGKSFWHSYKMTQKDTRTIAQEWIEESIPQGTKIGFDWYAFDPNLFDPSRYTDNSGISGELKNYQFFERIYEKSKNKKIYQLIPIFDFADSTLWGDILPEQKKDWEDNFYIRKKLTEYGKSVSQLKKEGVEYVITSSFSYGMPTPPPDNPIFYLHKRHEETYIDIEKTGKLIKTFSPKINNLGPTIKIYQL